MAVDYRNGVSILILIFYLPALAIAILLTIRHGFGRSAGWRFMIIFTLARILSACFQLATINQPKNVSLYVGYSVLIGIAVSPLELVAFGLLSRITASINKYHQTLVTARHLQLAELLNIVGIILSIVGGVDSGEDYQKTGRYLPQTLTKVGLGLFIASFVAIMATAAILSLSISHAEPGEKRILLAVAVSLPLLLVRLIYASIYTFGKSSDFSALSGSVTILLCMALLEEIAIVLVYEGVGLTLRKVIKQDVATGEQNRPFQRCSG
ncbi:MAG: hypothetical protein ALECFALPRED_001716 [Alectoria fallacina]|uniref:DUF7702 domain-containing protein n=1 Tax=Alectoria fallacina TaxID=1903189 RepID=A0A8H3F839_9LECA|nr:MAG: hypothetical protein ALECFALPRED_001716 [Alectoria fallacina]